MKFEITPYERVGPIRFGLKRETVRQLLEGPVEEFSKTSESKIPTDDFVGKGIHVYYRAPGICQAVEMASPAEPVLEGRSLLALSFSDVWAWLVKADAGLQVDDSGLTSLVFGIGVFAPRAIEEPNEPAEAVIAFERGYYD